MFDAFYNFFWNKSKSAASGSSENETMSLETDAKAVLADVAADVKKGESDVKAEFEKVFATAKVDAVSFDGSVAAEIVALKKAVAANATSASIIAYVKTVETKVDAVIAKLGVKI